MPKQNDTHTQFSMISSSAGITDRSAQDHGLEKMNAITT